MSVSSVNPATAQTYQPTGGSSSSTSSTSETRVAVDTSGSTAASASQDAPASSSTVTLSPDAQALATFASAGITFSEVSLSSLGISPNDIANATTPALQFALMQRVAHGMPHADGAVSQSDFEKLAAQFGGTKAQADQLFQDLDTNGNGAISNEEFLNGLAKTSNGGSSPVAQSLLELMNTDGSGSVSFSEFSKFETAFVEAEKGGS